MTTPKQIASTPETLKDEELQIAVHRARGLLVKPLHRNMDRVRIGGPTPGTKLWQIPDYPNDLNAMHEAEKLITTEEEHWRYLEAIRELVGHSREFTWSLCHATARQRCIAFVKVMEGKS